MTKTRERGRRVAYAMVAALALSSGVAVAQARDGAAGVAGMVRGSDGVPLAQARVAVVGAGRVAITDAEGRFVLRPLPPGRHRLEVSRIGYAPAIREVVVPNAGAAEAEIVLVPTPLALPGIQVTGTPGARDARYVAQATTQLGGRALERSLSGTLAETLAEQPGVGVRYNGPGAAAPVVRGLTGDRVLVLQDGQRAADLAGSADDHGLTVDPLAAQRIEVVRGPAALLYGNNALAGVVHVITGDVVESVPSRPEWMVAAHAESGAPGAGAMLRGTVPLSDRWALLLRGGVRTAADVRVGRAPEHGGRLPNTDRQNGEAVVGLAYAGEQIAGRVTARSYGFGYGLPMPPDEPDPVRLRGRIRSGAGSIDAAISRGPFSALRIAGTVQDYFHDERTHGEVEMAFGLRTRTADLLLRQRGLGRVRGGAWGMSGMVREYAATGAEQLTAPADARALGAFTYQELPLHGGGTMLQLGARVDRYLIRSRSDPRFGPGVERVLTTFSGSAGLSVPLAEGIYAAASAARSFRAPTVEELFSNALHAGTGAYELGDAGLAPEYALGLDAVLRVHTARWNGEFAAYHNRVRDFVHFAAHGDTVLDGTRWPVLAYVQSDARLNGVEGYLERLLAHAIVVSIRGDRVIAERVDGTPLPYTPAARLGGSVRWEPGALSLGGSVRHGFAQPRVGYEGERATGAYTLLGADAGLRWRRGRQTYSVTVRLDNLTDRLYHDAASRAKNFAPSPGRSASLVYRAYF